MTTLPLADVRARLSELVESAVTTHERIEVTRKGRRAVVILSADDYDSLLETLDVLSDPETMVDIAEHHAHPEDSVPLAEVEASMRRSGRLRA